MSFSCIVTTIGQTKIAAAISSGVDLPLTEMAVGDGSGNPTTPTAGQTALVRETYRANLGSVSIDQVNPNRVIAEMTIPAAEGGWVLREVGIFDDVGDLIAVANYPDTYKPLPSEGAARDLTIRVLMQVADTSAVTLGIDASQVFATQAWVELNYSIAAQLPGGTTGQVARKASNADGDIIWGAPDAPSSFIVDVIRETQVLAAGQTVVNLATLTTNGLSLYIEGIRDEGFTTNSATQITLDRSYPAGTRFYAYQNTPIAPSNFARKDLANTFTAANTFAGTDPGSVSAGQVTIGGGQIRASYSVIVGSSGGALYVQGGDPGFVAAGQVAIGGGSIRTAGVVVVAGDAPSAVSAGNVIVGGGRVWCAQNGGGPAITMTDTAASGRRWEFYLNGVGANGLALYNRTDNNYPIEWTSSGVTLCRGSDPGTVSSGQVGIGGGRIVAGQSINVDTGVGTIGVLGLKSAGVAKWSFWNRDDAGGSLQIIQGSSGTVTATFKVGAEIILYGSVAGTGASSGETKIGGGKIDTRTAESMVLRLGSNNASGGYTLWDTSGTAIGYAGSPKALISASYANTAFAIMAKTDLYLASNDGINVLQHLTNGGQVIFYGSAPGSPSAGEIRIGGGVIKTAGDVSVGGTLTVANTFDLAGTTPSAAASGHVIVGGGIIDFAGELRHQGVKVLGARITGWGAPTGPSYLRQSLTDSSTAANVLHTLKALIQDLFTQGIIGA